MRADFRCLVLNSHRAHCCDHAVTMLCPRRSFIAGTTKIELTVRFGSYDMDPTEYVLLFLAFSVIFQTFVHGNFDMISDHLRCCARSGVFSSSGG